MSPANANNYYPAFSSDQVFKDHEARDYVERYFPNALNYENQNQYANQNPQYSNQNSQYSNQNSQYSNQNPQYGNQNPQYSNQYQQQQQPQDPSNYYNQRPPYYGGQVNFSLKIYFKGDNFNLKNLQSFLLKLILISNFSVFKGKLKLLNKLLFMLIYNI
jgi:hypothetical protein